ncbi:zinc metalloprotease [Nocardiopsis valliformis]|uniref:zinc metalloprotease n=1 Tax=Nocardiopsis valliformis TaxID=239974 RepID=UPI00034D8E7C|nr:zinc metalloprotease [Nocardiopsis valliformis]
MIGRSPRGGSAATWSGLTLCALALTGLVATTLPEPADPEPPGPGPVAAFDDYCPPGQEPRAPDSADTAARESQNRVADPGAGTAEGVEVTPEQAVEYEEQLREALVAQRGRELAPPHTVPVVVHVISAEDGRGDVSDRRIRDQIDVLNRAFRGDYARGSEGTDTGFRFELSAVTRHADNVWFGDFNRHRDTIRSRLRQGGPETLNVYTTALDSGLLGYSTFPQNYANHSAQDGVVIAHDTLPGGERDRFNEGHTGTHEVGHWLGLFHTFQNGCQSPGDYVDDTPYEREAAAGCPKGRNTCPHLPGKDPVTNFMNYSDDACMTHFTQGQARRMIDHWTAFRGSDTRA